MKKNEFQFPHSPIKIIAFIITAAFFILTSYILIASAVGYKIDFNKNGIRLKATGGIILTSQPSGADIYINGKLYSKKTGSNFFTTQITGLLPGTYDIKIEKEGFLPWEKKVQVIEKMVAWENYPVLFPKDPQKQLLLKEDILLAKQSNNSPKIALLSKDKNGSLVLETFDPEKKITNIIQTYSKAQIDQGKIEIPEVAWSHDDTKLLVKEKINSLTDYFVVSLNENNTTMSLAATFKLNFDKIIWDTGDSRVLYGLDKGLIHKINISDKTIADSGLNGIITIDIGNDRLIYAARNVNGEISAWRINFNGKKNTKIIKALPKSNNYNFIQSSDNANLLVIVDGVVRTLYLADKIENNLELTQLSQDATGAAWSPNNERVLYWNEKNAWVYDLRKKKLYETIKNSDIRDITWDQSNDHLLVNLAGAFITTEFDGKNTVKIGNTNLSNIFYSGGFRNYYFISPDKNSIGNLMVYTRTQ